MSPPWPRVSSVSGAERENRHWGTPIGRQGGSADNGCSVNQGLYAVYALSEMETVTRVLAVTALDVCQRDPAELALLRRPP